MYKIWIDGDYRFATIPLGVPLNQKYKVFGSRMFGSQMDKNFKKAIDKLRLAFARSIKPIPKMMKGKKFIDKNVMMWVDVYDADNRRDIDAVIKSGLDAMNGILYEDDSQVHDLNIRQFVDKVNPRLEIKCVMEKRY